MRVARPASVVQFSASFPLFHQLVLTQFDHRCQRRHETVPIHHLRAVLEILAVTFAELGGLVFDGVYVQTAIRNEFVQEATDLNVLRMNENIFKMNEKLFNNGNILCRIARLQTCLPR